MTDVMVSIGELHPRRRLLLELNRAVGRLHGPRSRQPGQRRMEEHQRLGLQRKFFLLLAHAALSSIGGLRVKKRTSSSRAMAMLSRRGSVRCGAASCRPTG